MSTSFESICKARFACGPCRSSAEWRAAFGAPEICPFGIGWSVMNASICESRAHCQRCRTSKAWREANNAPEECPFATDSVVINHMPLKKIATVEDSKAECMSRRCDAYDAKKGCNSCGCSSKPHRPIDEVKICPRKWWIRTISEDRIEP